MPGPFTRLMVPDTPGAGDTQSSYLRLGGYFDGDSDLVTGLTTTTSSNTSSSVHAITQADSKMGTGSKTSDKERVVKVEKSKPISSSGKGILAYSNGDFHANIAGAALMKFGAGHTTEVTTADASYSVKAGFLSQSAENGVSITAGPGGTAADLSLTASNYIKQTAKGPLSEITYGHSEKRTIGDAMEFFGGTKWTCLLGAETTLKLAISTSLFIGLTFTFKISFDFSMTLASTVTLRWGGSLTLTFATKGEFIVGNDFKQVAGNSTKIVVGPDVKLTTSDLKSVLTNDLKTVVGGDMKNVTINFTKAIYDAKDTVTTLTADQIKAYKETIATTMGQLRADTGNLTAIQTKIGFAVM